MRGAWSYHLPQAGPRAQKPGHAHRLSARAACCHGGRPPVVRAWRGAKRAWMRCTAAFSQRLATSRPIVLTPTAFAALQWRKTTSQLSSAQLSSAQDRRSRLREGLRTIGGVLKKAPLKFFNRIGQSARSARRAQRPLQTADSTGQRNTFVEHLSGCVEAERLAWPLVQLSRDRVELEL